MVGKADAVATAAVVAAAAGKASTGAPGLHAEDHLLGDEGQGSLHIEHAQQLTGGQGVPAWEGSYTSYADADYNSTGSAVSYVATHCSEHKLAKGTLVIVVGAASSTQSDIMVELGTARLTEDVVSTANNYLAACSLHACASSAGRTIVYLHVHIALGEAIEHACGMCTIMQGDDDGACMHVRAYRMQEGEDI